MSKVKRHLQWVAGSPSDGGSKYPVLALSIVGNVALLGLLFFKSYFPAELYIGLFAVLIPVPPVALGYVKRPFSVGVGVGTWPMFGLGLQLGAAGVPTEYIVNMLQSGIFYGGLALPVATAMFGIGCFGRERRLRGEHARRFARQALLTLALSAVIVTIRFTTDLLSTGVVH